MNTEAASGHRPERTTVLERVRALYKGNYAYVDDLDGAASMDCLEERGLTDDTVLIVTADHGEALFEHDYIGHNTQLYEESIRIPIADQDFPGESVATGRAMSSSSSILRPTILELVGIPVHRTGCKAKACSPPSETASRSPAPYGSVRATAFVPIVRS